MSEEVISTKITNVNYLSEEATIKDSITFVAATETYSNDSDETVDADVKLSYKETRSYTWSSQSSKPAVPITIETNLPVIVNEKVELVGLFKGPCQWGQPMEYPNQIDVKYKIKVPPSGKVTVNLNVTTVECDVPFHYTRIDNLGDGEEKKYEMEDGTYHCVMDSFSFNYE